MSKSKKLRRTISFDPRVKFGVNKYRAKIILEHNTDKSFSAAVNDLLLEILAEKELLPPPEESY